MGAEGIEDRWPLRNRTDLRDGLMAAYASRAGYHDVRHLREVLDRLTELGAGDEPELWLAAWYHDAVYDARGELEERSARQAEVELAGEDVDVAEVARLVRLTADHRPDAGDRNGALLCDADLAILAAEPARYAEYVAGVRADYAALDSETFRAGRLAVLEDLLARPALFHTDHATRHWEQAARANLRREIARLHP